MGRRPGEMSTPVKALIVVVAAVTALLLILGVQDSLVNYSTEALGSFISDVTGL